ncbi:MAG: hypothetical protein ACXVEF_39090, partial [Polyangiales bacterium]
MSRVARLRAFADACDDVAANEARNTIGGTDEVVLAIGGALAAAYPALRGLLFRRVDALAAIAREGWSAPRKRAELLRRLQLASQEDVRLGLRRASAVERLRIALRELDPEIEVDATAREWSELASAQLEVAV